jgi:hypothetical protein
MASPAKPMATISIVIAGSEMLLVEMLLVEMLLVEMLLVEMLLVEMLLVEMLLVEMLLVEMLLVESNGRRKSNPGTNPSRFLFIPYQPFNEAAPDGP